MLKGRRVVNDFEGTDDKAETIRLSAVLENVSSPAA